MGEGGRCGNPGLPYEGGSDPTQHAKGRTGDRPGPRKGATTRRNVTQGGGGLKERGKEQQPDNPCHSRGGA